jgi:hypothetical protein
VRSVSTWRNITGLVAFLALASMPGATSRASAQALGVGSLAPEVTAGAWINSQPLTLAGLRGKVVLVDFWTYG